MQEIKSNKNVNHFFSCLSLTFSISTSNLVAPLSPSNVNESKELMENIQLLLEQIKPFTTSFSCCRLCQALSSPWRNLLQLEHCFLQDKSEIQNTWTCFKGKNRDRCKDQVYVSPSESNNKGFTVFLDMERESCAFRTDPDIIFIYTIHQPTCHLLLKAIG